MKKSGLSQQQLEVLLEVTVDSALASIFQSDELTFSKAERNCIMTSIKALAMVAVAIDDRLIESSTLH